MSQAIGRTGLAKQSVRDPDVRVLTFTSNAQVTKTVGLDPKKSYRMYSSNAGPCTVTIALTADTPAAFKAGLAAYGPDRAPTAAALGDNTNAYVGHIAKGASGAKVTHTKSGSGTDNAGKVTALGGRFQIRFVPYDADVTDESGTTDFVPAAIV